MDLSKNIRDNNINKLAQYISNDKAKQLEQVIFNYTNEYCITWRVADYLQSEVYDSKINNILNNLDINNHIKNNYLINAINNDELEINNIPYLRPRELFPEHWEHIYNKLEVAEEKRKNLNVVESFPCKKCGCKKHKIAQMQTRGADEPMTVFITCQMCGNTLKKG
jgi:DNA-directed RNA polymerase subunit M/transcription elongation factor TFIIS